MPIRRCTYSYDENGNNTEYIRQFRKADNWVNNYKQTWEFNDSSILLTTSTSWWVDSAWIYSEIENYTYDENQKLTQMLLRRWKNNEWVNGQLNQFIYSIPQGVAENKMPVIMIWPNPGDGIFNLQLPFNQIKPGRVKFEVLDMSGKVLKTFYSEPGPGNLKLDISSSPAGICFIRTTINKQVMVREILKY